MTLRDFLNWFEGISENITTAPTDQQWEKIKSRLLALKDTAEGSAIPVPAAVPGAPDPVPGGTHVTSTWKGQVIEALEEGGYDRESALEVLSTLPVDLNADPKAVAQRVLSGAP